MSSLNGKEKTNSQLYFGEPSHGADFSCLNVKKVQTQEAEHRASGVDFGLDPLRPVTVCVLVLRVLS